MQQNDELPDGWIVTNISKVGEIVTGNTPPKKDPTNFGNKYPWVKPGDLDKNIPITKTEECLSEKGSSLARLLPINAVLVSCIGILGKVGIAGTQLATNQQINSISFEEEIVYPKYGYYYCKTLNKWLEDNSSATTIQIINKTRFSEAPFYLPPLAEQYRIVSAIEALFARLEATIEKLDKVLEILEKFRQSVFATAFDGRLTEDWRVSFQNLKVEDKNVENKINSNPVNLLENPININREILPALPNNWCWSTIEQLASDEPRSIQSGPFGSNLLHSEFQETGILAIGIDNVLDRSFSLGKEHRISYGKYKELEKYTARPLDVLITVMATVGRCCVIPQDIETAIITKHVYRITPNKEVISSYYLMNALTGASIVKEQIDNQIRGQTRPGINGKILKATSIPLPPLPEQQEIVRCIDALFAFADSIEAKVAAAREKTEKLRQSILAKAFSGELVETEAEIARREGRDYESAEVLLKRIKKEKGKNGKKTINLTQF